MKRLVFVNLLLFAVLNLTAQKSMDQIDREGFNAEKAPFDLPGILLTSTDKPVMETTVPERIYLDGEWEMAEGGDEQDRLNAQWENSIKATVPGSIHTALWKAGVIPDPYFGQNDSIAERQSYKTWWLKKEFSIKNGINAPILQFGGIANKCTVWLNGEMLGDHEGMFGGPIFEIRGLLKKQNTLIVRIDPIPMIFEPGGTFFGGANKSWRKTVVFNCVYGWHYSQIPSLGIWRPVEIINQAPVEFEDPFVTTRNVDGLMGLQLELKNVSAKIEGKLDISIKPENFDGEAQFFQYVVNSSKKSEKLNLDFRINDPKLWWPNDMGDQNLYRLEISFTTDNGAISDFEETTFAIRTIEMSPLPGGVKPDLYNWTFVINNKPMFVKGTGWCTMDPLMDFSREKYDRLLSVARLQHIQMLRAWGGGMPETDDFYDLCDRYGIMVMQEWPTAWDSHYTQPIEMLEETVRLNTLRLRNHPSLVMWGGGNESGSPYGAAIDMMGRLSIELDGTRPFHRGEAWGGSLHNYNCWWGEAHLNHNLNMTAPFWGEFGIASLPQMETIMKYLPDDEKGEWPPNNRGSFVHHMPIFGTVDEYKKLAQYSGYFMPNDHMDQFIIGSQLAQVVAVRHTLERARTMWPNTSGALYYKMNDNYPAASWSCVDFYGAIKPLHYFIQNSFAPVAAVVLFDRTNLSSQDISLPVYLLDDNHALIEKDWSVHIQCYNDRLELVHSEQFNGVGMENPVLKLGNFDLNREQTESSALFFVSEVKSGETLLYRTYYFFNFEVKKGSLFSLPRTSLETKRTDREIVIRNTGEHPAVGVNLKCPDFEDHFTASENYFWLNPNEEKTIEVNLDEKIEVECWNKL